MQRESDQFPPPRTVCHVKTQLAFIQTSAAPDVEGLHVIFIVADKQERSTAIQFLTIYAKAHIEKRITTQRAECGPNVCRPFAPAEALLFFTFPHDLRIKTKSGVVDKNVLIDFTDVDARY